jgi:hypothetical protein
MQSRCDYSAITSHSLDFVNQSFYLLAFVTKHSLFIPSRPSVPGRYNHYSLASVIHCSFVVAHIVFLRFLYGSLSNLCAQPYMDHCLVCVRSRYGDNNLVNMFGGRSCGITVATNHSHCIPSFLILPGSGGGSVGSGGSSSGGGGGVSMSAPLSPLTARCTTPRRVHMPSNNNDNNDNNAINGNNANNGSNDNNDVCVVDVACGYHHNVAVDAAGAVYTWGGNDKGQLGLGHTHTSM